MSWIDTAIDRASQPIEVDVRGLDMGVDVINVMPLSANEYQTLKTHPEATGKSGDDRNEYLGMRMVFEMLAKCDSKLTWGKFQQLPIAFMGELSTRVTAAVGGGALGES